MGERRFERFRGISRAAKLAGVTEADISRIRNADLNRFTIDRLVRILNRLDSPFAGHSLNLAVRWHKKRHRRAVGRGDGSHLMQLPLV